MSAFTDSEDPDEVPSKWVCTVCQYGHKYPVIHTFLRATH